MASAPGPDEIKRYLLNCTDCHSLQRVFQSRHSAADFLKVFERMSGYYPGASDLQPQRLVGEHRRPAVPPDVRQKFADYLASLNLSEPDGACLRAHDLPAAERPRHQGRS